MKNNGFIMLSRTFQKMPFWETNGKYEEIQAILDLFFHAAYEERIIAIKKQVITLQVGQQARSEVQLAKTWKWSRNRVRRFLKYLTDLGMIKQETNHLTSIITICEDWLLSNKTTRNNDENGKADDHLNVYQSELQGEQYEKHNIIKKETNNKTIKKINKKNKSEAKLRLSEQVRAELRSFFFYFFKFEYLQQAWNALSLNRVAEISVPVKNEIFERYLEYFYDNVKDDVDENGNIDFDDYNMNAPHIWAIDYLNNHFSKYITPYHRGKNPNRWKADLEFAFNKGTFEKVYAQVPAEGEDLCNE